jgi:hypothetical protein
MEYKLLNISTSGDDYERLITEELNEYASKGWRVIHGYSLAIGVYLLEREIRSPFVKKGY